MSVLSGSSYCEIDSNGCATDGAGSHGNGEACTIQVNVAGTLSATSFNTEVDYDYITIGSTRYHDSTGPSGVAVAAGSTFSWRSDSTVTNSGWTICLAPGMPLQGFTAQPPKSFSAYPLGLVHCSVRCPPPQL